MSRRAAGGLVHEHNAGIADKLDRNRQPLALLHAQPRRAWPPHKRLRQGLQLYQLHYLRTAHTLGLKDDVKAPNCTLRTFHLHTML